MLFYTHINEDTQVERKLMQETVSCTLVTVAGSGERVIALMDDPHLKEIHAVDVNEEALYLLELKLAALKALSVSQYLQFCGHRYTTQKKRHQWFMKISDELSPKCLGYWERNPRLIEKGIIHVGHFERFLHRIRRFVCFFLGKSFQQSFATGTPIKGWPQKRWNLLLYIFSLKPVYRIFGNQDLAFISEDASVGYISKGLRKLNNLNTCFMAHLIFYGDLHKMRERDLPPSLRKDILSTVKSRLVSSTVSINYHPLDLLSFVRSYKCTLAEPIFYSLSDILSFEPTDYLDEVFRQLKGQNHLLVWRAFLRHRRSLPSYQQLWPDCGIREHSEDERTGMYQVFSYINHA